MTKSTPKDMVEMIRTLVSVAVTARYALAAHDNPNIPDIEQQVSFEHLRQALADYDRLMQKISPPDEQPQAD